MLRTREAVRTLKEYHPPVANREGLRLDFNENTAGCSPRVLERLRQLDGAMLARYPEREKGEQAVAAHLGISPEELLLTNGTDEAIHLVCETYLQPGDKALIVVPTFAMFEIYAAATGAKVVSVPAGSNFEFPIEAVLSLLTNGSDQNSQTAQVRLIAIANPNNPTGTFVPLRDLVRIAEAAPQAAILVDEAYFEFCDESMMPKWREYPNLFVTRTFSKAYGLAGLRIGVLTGHEEQMQVLRRTSSPYNLNSVALECLPAALADQTYVREYVNQTIEGRDELEAELAAWGIRYWPSCANFVLFYLGGNCKTFVREMRGRGILVRDRSSDYGCKDCLRVTVGLREHNRRLIEVMREVFAELGIREQVAR